MNSLIASISLTSTDFNQFVVYFLTGILMPAAISITGYQMLVAVKWIEPRQLQLEVV